MSKIVLLWAAISESSLVTLATTAMGVVGSAIVAMFGYLGQRKARRKPLKARPPFLVAFGLGVLIGVPAVWVIQTRPSQMTMLVAGVVVVILLQSVGLWLDHMDRGAWTASTASNHEMRRAFDVAHRSYEISNASNIRIADANEDVSRTNANVTELLARLMAVPTDKLKPMDEERSA